MVKTMPFFIAMDGMYAGFAGRLYGQMIDPSLSAFLTSM